LTVNCDTLLLSWREVPNARYYTVNINGDNKDSRKNNYSLESLQPGDYTIKVKACGNGDDYRDSGWSEKIEFVRVEENGLTYSLINSRTEYEVTGMGTAGENVVVPDTFRGKPVTSIGTRAFANRNKLVSVTLPDTVTNISAQAFYNCSYLTKVNLPKNLTNIGTQAFQGCRALTGELVIPEGITTIPENAFAYCRRLQGIEIGENVTVIEDNAFSDCNGLDEIVIPDNVESIGEYAFSKCEVAQSITFGSGVQSLGGHAFYGCKTFETLELGDSLTDIGEYAFADCISLKSVKVDDGVKTLGEGVFQGCTRLTDVSLGAGLEKIGKDAFFDTELWKEEQGSMIYVDDWFVAPKERTLNSYTVKAGTRGIANSAFAGCYNSDSNQATQFVLPNTVQIIGDSAFADCRSVTQITLPNSVEVIGESAFARCKALSAIAIGSGVKSLGANAFINCEALSIVRLGEYDAAHQATGKSSLETIGDYAFYGCARLNSIEIPDTVKTIGSGAFRNAGLDVSATDVVYADNWVVGYKSGMISMGGVVVKDGVKGIANYAFSGAPMLLSVTLPDSVETIGRSAFMNCPMLTVVKLPQELKRIEDYTFYGCTSLLLDTLPEGLTYIGRSAFYNCHLLGMENMSADPTEAELDRFTFVIPDSVETIEAFAFYGCGMEFDNKETGETVVYGVRNLVIGSGVKSIGSR
ncbi:MAG: leucine-rich repeat domain-containing protein, partial [Clostridiales bacterium]|nr:leucine-rich repeat domain-containing protein [Clostridiales bacterium]